MPDPYETVVDHVNAFLSRVGACDFVELVIDTSVGGPALGLWAFDVQRGESFERAWEKSRAHDDFGFLTDILDERACDSPGPSLSGVFPRWPDALEAAERELAARLESACAAFAVERVWLHHVGSFEVRVLRTPDV